MKTLITIKESIFVSATPEEVWDFTQDYTRRTSWDKSVVKTTVLQEKPNKVVEVVAKGNIQTTFIYKLENKPHKTTLALLETNSFFITGGGGSWTYESKMGKTLWTQKNSLVLKKGMVFRLVGLIVRIILRYNTKTGMKSAKRMIEKK